MTYPSAITSYPHSGRFCDGIPSKNHVWFSLRDVKVGLPETQLRCTDHRGNIAREASPPCFV